MEKKWRWWTIGHVVIVMTATVNKEYGEPWLACTSPED